MIFAAPAERLAVTESGEAMRGEGVLSDSDEV